MDSICIGKDIDHMRYIQEKNVIAQRRILSSAPHLRLTSMHRLDIEIVSPEVAFDEVRASGVDTPTLVIASSFSKEILPRVRELGWQGDVIDMDGSRL